ncbi:MAG: 4'-phosphopantetheinyl transferase superfamily protein [Candidatus Falkowbacteria bacterium]
MLKIYVHDTRNDRKGGLMELTRFLSAEEKERADRFKFEKDFKLYTAGKILARKIIADHIGIAPKDIKFFIDKYGRPFLEDPKIKDFDFNISHSGDYVVLAFSHRQIGVDIEKIRPVDFKIAETCFHDKESEYLNHDPDKRLENFFRLWTLKESFIKAVGQGLSCPLKDFYFSFTDGGIKINILKPDAYDQTWNFRLYDFDPEYKLAVCAKDLETPPVVKINNLAEL